MLLESACPCSVCCPSSLWSINFTFPLIFLKLSEEKVHAFIWWAVNHLFMKDRPSGCVNVLFSLALGLVFCRTKAQPKHVPLCKTKSLRILKKGGCSREPVLPRSPMVQPSAESGLQWARTCRGRAGASPCQVEVVLALSTSCKLIFRKEASKLVGCPEVPVGSVELGINKCSSRRSGVKPEKKQCEASVGRGDSPGVQVGTPLGQSDREKQKQAP